MAKHKGGMLGMLLAGVAAATAAFFLSKKSNRTKAVRVAKKIEKKVMKAEKTLRQAQGKKAPAKKKSVAKKGKKRSGIKRK